MARIRSKTRRALHLPWCAVTTDWVPEVPDQGYFFYALRYGVIHMLAAGQTEAARERLSDLLFTGAYLDWCYSALSDDFSPLLRLWRALGEDQARTWYTQATKRLHLKDPQRLVWLRHVVEFTRDAGWWEEAVAVAEAALQTHIGLVGEDHPQTATSSNQLALALKATGRVEEAIPLASAALTTHRAHLGPDDAELYVTMNSLASMLNRAKRYSEAEPLFREAIEHRRRLLGTAHPKTLISTASFAYMLTKMGKHEDSEPFHRQAYTHRRKILGERHPKTLGSCVNLGRCLGELGQFDEATALLDQAVATRKEVLGPEHPRTLNAQKRLRECRKARSEAAASG